MKELYQQSACELTAWLSAGEITPHDALDCLEQRIEKINPQINALVTLCFDRARQQADSLTQSANSNSDGLCGLPVAIKDLTNVSQVRTTFGSMVYQDHVPNKSDQLVTKIENGGGVIFGKTNTPEFGAGGISFNDVFGSTRSPRNTAYSAGGSSGGAAASLASGCSWLSHGSDMAGSLRTPASFCGVTSLRPSPGLIRSDSEFLPFDVLSAEGPMARSIEDLGLFADSMISPDHPSLLRSANTPQQPDRVAISRDLGITNVSDDVLQVFDSFVEDLTRMGCNVFESQPDLTDVHESFDTLRAHGNAISLEHTLAQFPGIMKPELEWNIRSGLNLNIETLRQARRTQGKIISAAATFMQDFDLLICPATSVSSVPMGLRYPGADKGVAIPEYYRWLAIAYGTTMTTLPIITMPCGIGPANMPIGIQLIGRPWGESQLFRYASYLQRQIGWCNRPIDPQNNS